MTKMTTLMGWIKAVFPAPRIPQKRYLVVFGFALYYAAKVYVGMTPDPADDDLPDRVRAMFADNTEQRF